MTDHDLLLKAAEAFESIPIAHDARKMLKRLGRAGKALPYAGNGSHILARVMAEMIREHLAK